MRSSSAIVDDPPIRASDGGVFRDGFDAELDEARTLTRDGQRLIVELEGRLREEAQIPSLKLRYTRVFGWYVEVTRTHLAKAPKAWRRKQTVATGERFTCDELDALADKLAHAEDRSRVARGASSSSTLVKKLAAHSERLRSLAARLAALDVASALAELAHRDDYTRPDVDDSFELDPRGRAPSRRRAARRGRALRAQRRRPRCDGRGLRRSVAPVDRHRPEHGRQIDVHAAGGARGGPRADRVVRAGAAREDRRRRPRPHARRRERQPRARREHLHGRDEGDGEHPSPRHAPLARRPRRDRPRHEHVRRPLHRVGGGRAPARRRRLSRAVRDALPRAHRSHGELRERREPQRERARARRDDRVLPQGAARRGLAQLRRRVRASRRAARAGARARARHPRVARARRSVARGRGGSRAGSEDVACRSSISSAPEARARPRTTEPARARERRPRDAPRARPRSHDAARGADHAGEAEGARRT